MVLGDQRHIRKRRFTCCTVTWALKSTESLGVLIFLVFYYYFYHWYLPAGCYAGDHTYTKPLFKLYLNIFFFFIALYIHLKHDVGSLLTSKYKISWEIKLGLWDAGWKVHESVCIRSLDIMLHNCSLWCTNMHNRLNKGSHFFSISTLLDS